MSIWMSTDELQGMHGILMMDSVNVNFLEFAQATDAAFVS